jgi:hypothetical protein
MSNRLETLMRKCGRILQDQQIARLFKVPEEMQQTPCDFFGYTRTGRAILIECKMVKRTALPIGDSPGLQPHQWCELEDAHRAGALSLIAWSPSPEAVAVFSWAQAAQWAAGRASIPWKGIPTALHRDLTDMGAASLLSWWLPPISAAK